MKDYISTTMEGVAKSMRDALSTTVVYGEPVSAEGVTVVPVSKVTFGFGGGAGGGTGTQPAGEEGGEGAGPTGEGGGGGGGGGGSIEPMGYIEITGGGSRWVPLEPSRAELALRVLTMLLVLVPGGGGRRGLIGRLVLSALGQAAIGRMFRPRLPSIPEGLRPRAAPQS